MGLSICQERKFREADTRGPTEYAVKDEKVLQRLNDLEKFENTFPFYRMRIDHFVGRVTRFVAPEDGESVSMR